MRLVAIAHFDHEAVDESGPAVEVDREVRLNGRAQFLACGLGVGVGSSDDIVRVGDTGLEPMTSSV